MDKKQIDEVFRKGILDASKRANVESTLSEDKRRKMEELKNKLKHKIDVSSLNKKIENLPTYTPSIKANQRLYESRLSKEKKVTKMKCNIEKLSTYVDPRLKAKTPIRKKRSLIFNTAGTYIKKAQLLRSKEHIQRLKESVALATQKTGIATAVKLSSIQPMSIDNNMFDPREPWDTYLLKDESMSMLDLVDENFELKDNWEKFIDMRWITDLIEHPIEPKDKAPITEMPLMLTKKECKKLRRQNRAELQREQQEKIRLGLIKPPPPKVRLSNLMRVYGAEAAANPTRLHAFAKAQEEERHKQHEMMNASRKLTKEEKHEKIINKLHEDPNDATLVSVYKVKNLTNPSQKFKVEKNANQLSMTGVVVIHPSCSVIVVEGNEKKQRFFQRLMMHRIKWDNSTHNVTAVQQNGSTNREISNQSNGTVKNHCQQIVNMIKVKSHSFGKMEFKVCPNELHARDQFRKYNVENYWDLAYSKDVLQSAGELDSL